MSLRIRAVLGVCAAVATGAAVALAGCAQSDGVRIEGSAPVHAADPPVTTVQPSAMAGSTAPDQGSAEPTGRAAPSARPTRPEPKVDIVKLLKADPLVKVKKELRACTGDGESYPLEIAYADLTDDGGTDLVVNVSTCTDGLGVASYVYRSVGRGYRNVFTAEQPQVWAQVTASGLEVAQQIYLESDPVYDPSSETVTTYRWNGRVFVQTGVTRNDYGKQGQ